LAGTRTRRGNLPRRLFGFFMGLVLWASSPSFAGTIPPTYQTLWGLSSCVACPTAVPKVWLSPYAACQGHFAQMDENDALYKPGDAARRAKDLPGETDADAWARKFVSDQCDCKR
jgi:hypothetical protein